MTKSTGGAPRKAVRPMARVLFVRVDRKLLTALDKERAARSVSGVSAMSRSDVVRDLLWKGLRDGS